MAEVTGLRNSALPYPVYGVPFGISFPLLDADGDPISPSSPDSEVSKNGDTFADCTNEATEIATSSGSCYLLLTGTEMTADVVTVQIKSTGAKTTVLTLYPRKLVVLSSGTCQGSNDTGDIQLASGDSAIDDTYNGCLCVATIDSVVEARIINDYVGSTKVGEVTPAWATAQPDSNDTYVIYLPEGRQVQPANVTHVSGTVQTAADVGGIVSSGTHGNAALKTLIDTLDNFVDTEIADIQARLPAALGANGNLKADVRDWIGTAVATPTVAGVLEVDMTHVQGDSYQASGLASVGQDYADAARINANMTGINGSSEAVNNIEANYVAGFGFGEVLLNTTIATLASQTSFTLTEGSDRDNTYVGCRIVIGDNTVTTRKAIGIVSAYTGATKTVTLQDDPGIFTMAALEKICILATQRVLTNASGHVSRVTLTDTATALGIDAVNSTALAASAVTEIQSGLATASALATLATAVDTIDNILDTEFPALVTAVDDLPTNAELATALGTADDAVLAAIAALNNLSQANIRTALGMSSANLDTQLDALPTNTELATALGTADDAVLAAIAALNNLSQANIRTAIGLGSANLDTQLALLATAAQVDAVDNFVDTEIAAIQSTLAALFTTAMTESYGADGATVTLAQGIYEIMQTIGERSISSTTGTVKKRDGSTTAFTQTFNSATTPTAVTRS